MTWKMFEGRQREPCLDRRYWNILGRLRFQAKPVAELTEEEKFAICFTAGIPMQISKTEHAVTISSIPKCKIVLNNGNYEVWIEDNE